MSEKKPYVLAMYDVRGKQNFIFRSTHLKEIVGGSCIIRDCFRDYLFPAANEYRSKTTNCGDGGEDAIYKYSAGEGFSHEDFEKRMEGGRYIGEVVYEGGGNFLVLYKDKETWIEVNKIFTKNLLEKTHSLNVLSTMVEIDGSFKNYKEDSAALYRKHQLNEACESVIAPTNTLPIVQIEYNTQMPLTDLVDGQKVSRETGAKLRKYKEVTKGDSKKYGEKMLDNLVHKKGEESILAVIFIDGNSMGAKVEKCLEAVDGSYDRAITELREFSMGIQKDYVDDRMDAIDKALDKKYKESDKRRFVVYAGDEMSFICNGRDALTDDRMDAIDKALDEKYKESDKRRFVVYAGDEMSFICNGRDALTAVKAYFEGLPKGSSACAGIALFHSHAPYAEAYKIAEECCEEGKKIMKARKELDTCYLDFHYCQGGMGMDLDTIRQRECQGLISKPWLIKDNSQNPAPKDPDVVDPDVVDPDVVDPDVVDPDVVDHDVVSLEEIEAIVAELNKLGSRTNIKGLAEAATTSPADFDMEMNRIYAHQSEQVKKEIKNTFTKLSGKKRLQMVYDIVTVYDLWFREVKQ